MFGCFGWWCPRIEQILAVTDSSPSLKLLLVFQNRAQNHLLEPVLLLRLLFNCSLACSLPTGLWLLDEYHPPVALVHHCCETVAIRKKTVSVVCALHVCCRFYRFVLTGLHLFSLFGRQQQLLVQRQALLGFLFRFVASPCWLLDLLYLDELASWRSKVGGRSVWGSRKGSWRSRAWLFALVRWRVICFERSLQGKTEVRFPRRAVVQSGFWKRIVLR